MKGKKSNNPTKGVMPSDPAPSVVYSGKDSKVVAAAKKRKRGGKVVKMDDKKSKMRLDRPGRKRGGRAGADQSPLSSAAGGSNPVGHKATA